MKYLGGQDMIQLLKTILHGSMMLLTLMLVFKLTWKLTPFWIKKLVRFSYKTCESSLKLIIKSMKWSYKGLSLVIKELTRESESANEAKQSEPVNEDKVIYLKDEKATQAK